MNALPYEDPPIETILIVSSFFLLLNGIDWLLNVTLFCGLLGQIIVGVAWGSPGLKLLAPDVEKTVTYLGYIGLILLVFEGGLLSSFKSLQSTLCLSISAACTGVAVPIGLSFLLRYLTDATYLQCFAAGAALCSTSLGTTITVLQTSGYVHTRLGTVLTSAALLDDIVGLLMAQIIQDLGISQSSLSAVDIVRPIASSVGLMVVMVLLCNFCIGPLTRQFRITAALNWVNAIIQSPVTALIIQLAILIGLVTSASYAGASNLLAAYIAGAAISWWYSECKTVPTCSNDASAGSITSATMQSSAAINRPEQSSADHDDEDRSGSTNGDPQTSIGAHHIYDVYLAQVVNRVLKPLFFASIGFSVPVTLMFAPDVLWRGVVYSLLMTVGKFIVGLWLIRLGLLERCVAAVQTMYQYFKAVEKWTKTAKKQDTVELCCDARSKTATERRSPQPTAEAEASGGPNSEGPVATPIESQNSNPSSTPQLTKPPLSLYPGLILGSAMVARGEIGYLIASLAQSNGLLSQQSPTGAVSEDLFLIVIWAISLCTLVGPLATGLLVRRVKKLESAPRSGGRAYDPLGAWGEL